MTGDEWRLDKDAEDAKTLVIAAVIVQLILTLLSFAYFAAFSAVIFTPVAPGGTPGGTAFIGAGLFLGIGLSFLVIGILWVVLDYYLIYRKIADGQIEDTDTSSLVLGILQLILGGFVSGILILIAHGKITSSINHRRYKAQSN